jgi:hypothetical protein
MFDMSHDKPRLLFHPDSALFVPIVESVLLCTSRSSQNPANRGCLRDNGLSVRKVTRENVETALPHLPADMLLLVANFLETEETLTRLLKPNDEFILSLIRTYIDAIGRTLEVPRCCGRPNLPFGRSQ